MNANPPKPAATSAGHGELLQKAAAIAAGSPALYSNLTEAHRLLPRLVGALRDANPDDSVEAIVAGLKTEIENERVAHGLTKVELVGASNRVKELDLQLAQANEGYVNTSTLLEAANAELTDLRAKMQQLIDANAALKARVAELEPKKGKGKAAASEEVVPVNSPAPVDAPASN